MYETPEVEKMDSKTGPIPVVVNFAAVVDNVVAAVYDAVVAAYAFWYSADNDGTGQVRHKTSRQPIEQSPRLSLHAIDCAAPANAQSALKSCL